MRRFTPHPVRPLAVAAAILATLAHTTLAVHPCGPWTLYKQCGESWSNDELGTASGVTVCDAGCAMSSVAMALATNHETVDHKHVTPGTLNHWLAKHGGYEGGDELVWNAVSKLGNMTLKSFTQSMSTEHIVDALKHCRPVIANVRDRTHWVLITGYDAHDSNKFYVNDPGFPDTDYLYSGMGWFVEYTRVASEAMPEDEARAVMQAAPAFARKAFAAAPVASPEPAAADVGHVDGVVGVDVSTPLSKDEVHCLKKNHGVSVVAARCYTEDGHVDGAAVETYHAASAHGMRFEVYHFPCQSQGAETQIHDSIHHLHDNGVDISTFWLDIENSDWGHDHSRNVKFITDLAKAAASHGVEVGIYTSAWSWGPITGDSHALHSHLLWWPSYSTPSHTHFEGFEAFGGWKRPYQHQYAGNVNVCGANVDMSWRPTKGETVEAEGADGADVSDMSVAVQAPNAHVESCSFMKSLVDRTFHNHHDVWLCIAHAESSYIPDARNPSGATGLFQVMPMHCGEPGCPPRGSSCVRDLEDPEKNAKCAHTVYKEQGFEAWTTYPGCTRGGGPCQQVSESDSGSSLELAIPEHESAHVIDEFGNAALGVGDDPLMLLPSDFSANLKPEPELFRSREAPTWALHEGSNKLADMLGGHHHNVTRTEVMKRAYEWVQEKIPYCQCLGTGTDCCAKPPVDKSCKYCTFGTPAYRCDCSGFVSWAWKLPGGLVAHEFETTGIAHPIKKHELKRGDIMLKEYVHVALFDGWVDESTKTHYYVVQEAGCHEAPLGPWATRSVTAYPFGDDDAFKPFRYRHIVDA